VPSLIQLKSLDLYLLRNVKTETELNQIKPETKKASVLNEFFKKGANLYVNDDLSFLLLRQSKDFDT